MRYGKLGASGLDVSRLCLGTMYMGEQTDEPESIRIINAALEGGVNFFDTAEVYTAGRSEEIVGKALASRRREVVIATKVRARPGAPLWKTDLSRRHIMEAVEGSLRRLGTDYIDLYQVHRWDPWAPLEETLRALDDLVRQGKVRYLGCSNFAAWQLCKALWLSDRYSLARFVTVQPLYNVMLRYQEIEVVPLCRDQGIGVIPYNPLAGGFLTGKYQRGQPAPQGTRFQRRPFYIERYSNDANFDRLDQVRALAAKRGLSLVDIAIAWLLHRPVVSSAIVGASSAQQVHASLHAADITLSEDEFAALNELWPPQGPPTAPGAVPPPGRAP